MIIKDIEIQDFRSHRHTHLNLDQGITVIVGENGSGKSSILEAVNFALFKQKPKDVNMDDLIRRGATQTRVSVTIYNRGKFYRVTRGRKIGKAQGSTLHCIEEGREILMATGEDEINRELENILSVNGDLFTNSIYIRQGEIDGLISANPAKRKELMGKLLGAEDLEKAHLRMGELLREYRISIEARKDLPSRIQVIRDRIELEKNEKKELDSRIGKLQENLKEKEIARGEFEDKLRVLSELKDLNFRKNEIEIKIRYANESLERIEYNEGILKDFFSDHKEYIEIQERIDGLIHEKNQFLEKKHEINQITKTLDEEKKIKIIIEEKIRTRISRYSEIMEIKVEDLDTLKHNYGEEQENIHLLEVNLEKRVKEIKESLGGINGQNVEINKSIAELEKAEDRCPVCSQSLSKDHKEEVKESFLNHLRVNRKKIQEKEGRLENLELQWKELKEYKKKIESINIEVLEDWARDLENKENHKKKQEDVFKALENAFKKIEDPMGLIKTMEDKKKSLEPRYRQFLAAKQNLANSREEKVNLAKELENLKSKLGALEKQIEVLSCDSGEIADLGLELKNLKDRISTILYEVTELEKGISGGQSALNEKNKMLDTWIRELKDLKDMQKENEKMIDYFNFLERVRGLFHKDNLQRELRERAIPLVEKYCREVFDRFDLPYSDISLDGDFSMKVCGTYGEETVEMLSGGERIAAALSLRIGIAKALSGPALESIMLDEPTIHLDNHRRLELVDIIRKLSTIPQTIVVTHDKEFEQSADVLLVVEKSDGISRVSQEG